jgi:hypothetical protein
LRSRGNARMSTPNKIARTGLRLAVVMSMVGLLW